MKRNLIVLFVLSSLFCGKIANAQISGNTNVCVGATSNFSDPVTGGTWTSINTDIATIDPSSGVLTAVSSGTVTVVYTAGTTTDNIVVTVISLPDPGTISGTFSLCNGSSTALSESVSGGVWSVTNSNASVDASGNVTGLIAGTDVIQYTVTNAWCSSVASQEITVNPVPLVDVMTGLFSVCAGSVNLLYDAVSGGVWSATNSNASVDASGNLTGLTAGTDIIQYTVSNAWCSSTTSQEITVNPLPVIPALTGTFSVCVGSTTFLSDALLGGFWSATNSNASIDITGNVTGLIAGTDVIQYTVSNTWCSSVASQEITVNPLPDAGVISGVFSVCSGLTTILNESVSGGVWSAINSNASVDVSGTVTGLVAGTDAIQYTVTNAWCSSVAAQTITVNPLPSAIGGTKNVCETSNRTLNDTYSGGTWTSFDPTTVTIGSSNGVMHGVLAGTTNITYTLPTGCIATTPVTVYPIPHAGTISGVSALSIGGGITLNETVSGGTWKSCNSSIASINSATGDVTAVADGETLITYSVPSAHCGTAYAYAAVTVGDCSTATNISTFAGNHTNGYSGDGGAATGAQMGSSFTVAADGSGNVYIADFFNNVVRMVNTTGVITTVAGTGSAGYSGDGGAATNAMLNGPAGVTVDGLGNVYIADKYNERIRKINTSGIISTIAGNGLHGGWNGAGFGYGGQATNAPLDYPVSVALDCSGNIFIADIGSQTVRKINSSGIISNFAGNHAGGYNGDGIAAVSAKLNNPSFVAADCFGNVYIADAYNNRIRKVNTSGIISTVAGNGTGAYSGDGGAATAASIFIPTGITLDACGSMYICDWQNNVVRKVDATGIISTFAGVNYQYYDYYTGDGGPATAAQMYLPGSLTIDGKGNLYIADYGNMVIRMLGHLAYKVRSYKGGTTQNMTVCSGTSASIDDLLSVPDNATGNTVTWKITAAPTHGTLNGFNASVVSKGGTAAPSGLTYAAQASYSGPDQFTIEMNDGVSKASTTITVTVNPSPDAGTISGIENLNSGTVALTDVNGDNNGIWSSSDNSIATVDNSGIVTEKGAGLVTISYTVSNSCGAKSATTKVVMTTNTFKQSEVVLFPNPNSGSFKCEFYSETDCQLELSVADVTGRVIYKQPIDASAGDNVANVTLPSTIVRPSVLFVTLGNNDKRYAKIKITVTE